METQELKFKTNINCSGCIEKVTPALNATPGIEGWKVDITNPQKILSVSANQLKTENIIEALKKVGYNAEAIES